MKSKKTILLTYILITSFLVSFNEPVSAVGAISDDVKAGNNYFYKVNKFPSFAEIIKMGNIADMGIDITSTGNMVGSTLYAKVLSTQDETLIYSDGTNNITETVPTIDIATGLITANEMSIVVSNTTNSEELYNKTLPAGLGLPIPFVFGSSTNIPGIELLEFDFSTGVLPIPLVLNNDFAKHANAINQLAFLMSIGELGTISHSTVDEIFTLSFDLNLDAYINLVGKISWRKSDGVALSLVMDATNSSTQTAILSTIDISLDREENINVEVAVGDKYKIRIKQADFEFDSTETNLTEGIEALKTEISNLVTFSLPIMQMDVKEVHGMYYRVEGSILNPITSSIEQFPEGDNELWLVGFGGLLPNILERIASNNTDLSGSHRELRTNATSGFVVSKDYEIYNAMDKTKEYFSENGMQNFIELLNLINLKFDDINIGSSTNDIAKGTLDIEFGETAEGGYSKTILADMDIVTEANFSFVQFENFDNHTGEWMGYGLNKTGYIYHKSEISIDSKIEISLSDKGVLNKLLITGDYSMMMKNEYNIWHNETSFADGEYIFSSNTTSIAITDLILEIEGKLESLDITTFDTSDIPPEILSSIEESPGFVLFLSIFSIIFVTVIFRKRY